MKKTIFCIYIWSENNYILANPCIFRLKIINLELLCFLVIFSNFNNFISFYIHLSFNTKMLLFARRLLERFWKKHIVRRSKTYSTPGGTLHSEVKKSRYELRKIQDRQWDPQGTFGANDFRRKFEL